MQQCRTVEKLFEQYGPVVRIGPSKVAFRDLSTMRNIYCVQKFDKSSYYKSLLTCVVYSSTAQPKLTRTYPPLGTTTITRTRLPYRPVLELTDGEIHRMTTLPHAEHTMRRKSYATHYNPANLSQFQPELQEFAFKLTDVRPPTVVSRSIAELDRCWLIGTRAHLGKDLRRMP